MIDARPVPAGPPAVYVVRNGDTLWGIAKRFSVTLRNLLAANPQVKDPSLIHVGDEIRIPAAYLPTLGGTGTSPSDINDRGQIVGWSATAAGSGHAVLIEGGRITDLGTLKGEWSEAIAINDNGQVVGWSDVPGETRGFLWEAGSMTALDFGGEGPWDINDQGTIVDSMGIVWSDGNRVDLGSLGGESVTAYAVNGLGHVVGRSSTKVAGRAHAFLWRDGEMTDLGTLGGDHSEAFALNDRGQVVGWSPTIPGSNGTLRDHAFLWQDGVMTDLGTLGGLTSSASAINDRGQVVGWSYTRTGREHAFLWQDGVMTDLGTLRGGSSFAHDINDLGQVLGWSDGHAFLWQDGVMTDLGPLGPGRGCG